MLLARPGHRELGHVELHAEVVQGEDGVHDDGHVAQRDLPGEDGARVVAWGRGGVGAGLRQGGVARASMRRHRMPHRRSIMPKARSTGWRVSAW